MNKKNKIKQKKVVMISGGFDPIHIGHIRYMQEAKKLGDKLIVVINNDNWFNIKGKHVFMNDKEKKEIIEALACVDEVIISSHSKKTKDISVCNEIKKIKPDIFANGGDRKPDCDPIPEVKICKDMGVKLVYNVGHGGKIRSSSDMLKKYFKHLKKKKS